MQYAVCIKLLFILSMYIVMHNMYLHVCSVYVDETRPGSTYTSVPTDDM